MTPEIKIILITAGIILFVVGAIINFGAKFFIKTPEFTEEDEAVRAEIEASVEKRLLNVKIFALWLIIIGTVILFILLR